MSEAAPESRVGTQFGPYRVIRLLARGGMGEVYEAHDTVKDRVVALKLMSQQYNSDGVFRRRMQREAHTGQSAQLTVRAFQCRGATNPVGAQTLSVRERVTADVAHQLYEAGSTG